MKPELQHKAMQLFNNALTGQGLLLLDTEEQLPVNSSLFNPLDAEGNIYQKQMNRKPVAVEKDITRGLLHEPLPASTNVATDILQQADRALLHKFSPPGVLINEAFEIFEFRGITSPWLYPAAGNDSFNLAATIRQDIAGDLLKQIYLARRFSKAVKKKVITTGEKKEKELLELKVMPLLDDQHWYNPKSFTATVLLEATKKRKCLQ